MTQKDLLIVCVPASICGVVSGVYDATHDGCNGFLISSAVLISFVAVYVYYFKRK